MLSLIVVVMNAACIRLQSFWRWHQGVHKRDLLLDLHPTLRRTAFRHVATHINNQRSAGATRGPERAALHCWTLNQSTCVNNAFQRTVNHGLCDVFVVVVARIQTSREVL